jgi:hypothetical protein
MDAAGDKVDPRPFRVAHDERGRLDLRESPAAQGRPYAREDPVAQGQVLCMAGRRRSRWR